MDEKFLLPYPPPTPDYKLTKSASFSELSSKKKIVIEKQYQTKTHGSLIKQYSCEQIFDKRSNTSQIKVSQMYKTDNAEHMDTWERTVPVSDLSKKLGWLNNDNTQTNLQKPFSSQKQTLTEVKDVNSRAIIFPAKLTIDENKLNQLSIKEEMNFGCEKQVDSNNGNFKEPSNYLFKKPSLLNKNFDNEKSDNVVETPKLTYEAPNIESDLFQLPTTNEEKKKHKLNTSQLKKRLRSLVAIEPKKKSKVYLCWSVVFFILLPLAVLSLALIFSSINSSNSFCTPRFSLKAITQDLTKYVYDQDVAVSKLAKFFNEKDNETSFEVIAFVGGIGVGKSYTAEIIKNNVKETDQTLDVFPPLYNKEDQVYGALSVCRCNLIRLENLKTDDIVDAASFISNLKKRAEKYCILVLALFNTEEVDYNLKRTIDYERSVSMIKDKFGKENLQPSVLTFTSLSNEALIKCIKDAGDYSNLKLTNANIEYVMRDLLNAESGCKGAYAKVQLVGRAEKQTSSDL